MPATRLEPGALSELLARYEPDAVGNLTGLTEGGDDRHCLVATTRGEWVLTLFPGRAPEDIAFELELTAHLAARGLPCAAPLAVRAGGRLGALAGRPAALAPRLPGRPVDAPHPAQCRSLGAALGRLHLAGRGFPGRRANDRGPQAWRRDAAALSAGLDPGEADLLQEELRLQGLFRLADLPRGIIHGAPLRERLLFEGDALRGLGDLAAACEDLLLYDLALAVNDCCHTPEGALAAERVQALLGGYQRVRPMSAMERGAWPTLLRAAALHLWLQALAGPAPPERPRAGAADASLWRRLLSSYRRGEAGVRRLWIARSADPGPAMAGPTNRTKRNVHGHS